MGGVIHPSVHVHIPLRSLVRAVDGLEGHVNKQRRVWRVRIHNGRGRGAEVVRGVAVAARGIDVVHGTRRVLRPVERVRAHGHRRVGGVVVKAGGEVLSERSKRRVSLASFTHTHTQREGGRWLYAP